MCWVCGHCISIAPNGDFYYCCGFAYSLNIRTADRTPWLTKKVDWSALVQSCTFRGVDTSRCLTTAAE